jgi:hypothetical protein
MDRVYNHINIYMGEARPACNPPMRFPLVKQVNVGKMLKDMQQCEVIFHHSGMKE